MSAAAFALSGAPARDIEGLGLRPLAMEQGTYASRHDSDTARARAREVADETSGTIG